MARSVIMEARYDERQGFRQNSLLEAHSPGSVFSLIFLAPERHTWVIGQHGAASLNLASCLLSHARFLSRPLPAPCPPLRAERAMLIPATAMSLWSSCSRAKDVQAARPRMNIWPSWRGAMMFWRCHSMWITGII